MQKVMFSFIVSSILFGTGINNTFHNVNQKVKTELKFLQNNINLKKELENRIINYFKTTVFPFYSVENEKATIKTIVFHLINEIYPNVYFKINIQFLENNKHISLELSGNNGINITINKWNLRVQYVVEHKYFTKGEIRDGKWVDTDLANILYAQKIKTAGCEIYNEPLVIISNNSDNSLFMSEYDHLSDFGVYTERGSRFLMDGPLVNKSIFLFSPNYKFFVIYNSEFLELYKVGWSSICTYNGPLELIKKYPAPLKRSQWNNNIRLQLDEFDSNYFRINSMWNPEQNVYESYSFAFEDLKKDNSKTITYDEFTSQLSNIDVFNLKSSQKEQSVLVTGIDTNSQLWRGYIKRGDQTHKELYFSFLDNKIVKEIINLSSDQKLSYIIKTNAGYKLEIFDLVNKNISYSSPIIKDYRVSKVHSDNIIGQFNYDETTSWPLYHMRKQLLTKENEIINISSIHDNLNSWNMQDFSIIQEVE